MNMKATTIICMVALVSVLTWVVYNAMKPTEWGLVRASLDGQEYYMLQSCRVDCDLLGYRYPVTEEGLQAARDQLAHFKQPDPVVIEEIK